MILNIINEEFSVCKVADYEGIDLSSPYIFIGSTDEEKSLVCPIQLVPDYRRDIGFLPYWHSRCNFQSACRWGNWYFRNFHIQHRLHTDKV